MGGAAAVPGGSGAVVALEVSQEFRSGDGILGSLCCAVEEVLQPLLHLTALTDGLESLVGDVAVAFRPRAQGEQRLRERTDVHQVAESSDPAEPAVAIEERLDRLELVGAQRATSAGRSPSRS